MSDQIPPGDETTLIDAVEAFLKNDALENLSGYPKFRARVALSLLATLRRELAAQSPSADGAGLARRLREGSALWDDPEIFAAAKAINRARLEVDNPKWIW